MSIPILNAAFQKSDVQHVLATAVEIAPTCYVGNFVTIYPGVALAERCIVMDGAVLGRIPIANRTVTRPVTSTFSKLCIGEESIIGCNAVLYTGSQIGARVMISDLSSIREGCVIDDDVVIGRGVMLLYNVRIGARSRIQDQTHLVGNMLIEEDVFIGMSVTTTNDNDVYITRLGGTVPELKGPIIRRYAVVGAGATLLPGIEIGTGAMVAAGAVVTHDVPPWTIAAGVPARHVRPIPPEWRAQVEALLGR